MDTRFALASRPAVVSRSVKIALVVGVVLVAINHGDVIARGHLGAVVLAKIVLNFLVPYAVSTASSVAALREMSRRPVPGADARQRS